VESRTTSSSREANVAKLDVLKAAKKEEQDAHADIKLPFK
jgi:hypothetical protein